MRAIILAAGAGRRLGLSMPKSMIDLAGRSILHRQLDAFRSAGVDDFIVVVGHACEQVVEHLAGQPGRFTFVLNERYAETNTVYSLYLARQYIDRDFFYANADVVFDARLPRRLVDFAACPDRATQQSEPGAAATGQGAPFSRDPKGSDHLRSEPQAQARGQVAQGPQSEPGAPGDTGLRSTEGAMQTRGPGPALAGEPAAALAVQVGRCGEEEVKVIVRDGRITRISKKLDPAECLGEFVGVALFGAGLAGAFRAALETCVEKENAVTDYFERAVDRLCDDWPLTPVDISDLPCIEIDFPEDLTRARQDILHRLQT